MMLLPGVGGDERRVRRTRPIGRPQERAGPVLEDEQRPDLLLPLGLAAAMLVEKGGQGPRVETRAAGGGRVEQHLASKTGELVPEPIAHGRQESLLRPAEDRL